MSHHAPRRSFTPLRTHLMRRLTAVTSVVLVLGLTACGSDSEDAEDANPEVGTTQSPQADDPAQSDESTESTGGTGGDTAVAEGSDENPLVLGFEISGPPGTVVEATTTTVADGEEQPEFDQTWTIDEEPRWQLFSAFVQGAVMTLKVVEGGPATVKGFRGNAVDPNDPTAGYAVSEELTTLEAEPGKIAVLSLP